MSREARALPRRCRSVAAAVAARLAFVLPFAACGAVDAPTGQPALQRRPDRVEAGDPASPPPPAPADHGLGLEPFAAEVAAAWRRDPAPVAVLPAFSDDPLQPRGTQVFVTGAGDWVAERVLTSLRSVAADVEVWAPAAVEVELARSNRSLRDVRTAADAVALVARTDAGYLVWGTVAKAVVGGRPSGKSVVRVQLSCVRLPGGESVATREHTLEDPAAVGDLVARAERPSPILVGPRAPAFTPSLDRELTLVAARALRRLVAEQRDRLAGRRCAVVVETGAGAAGQRLGAVARGALQSGAAVALPGREALTVVEAPDAAEVELVGRFERGTDRYTFVLAVRARQAADAAAVREVFDPRFTADLRQALP